MKLRYPTTFLATGVASAFLVSGCSASSNLEITPRDSSAAAVEPSSAADAPLDGGSTGDDSAVADAAAVDAVIDHFINGTVILTNMQGETLDDMLAQYEQAQSERAAASDELTAGIPGIPDATTASILASIDQAQSSMDDLSACFRDSTTSNCDDESALAADDAKSMGEEMAALIPYGSRSEDEVLAALDGTETGSSQDSGSTVDEGQAQDETTGSDAGSETVSQTNAVEMAQNYIDYQAFSRTGLIDQLKFEGFSTADATYGVDALDVDWNEQAALKAQEYLDYSAFSRSGLIDQLIYEGFTRAQATYGVDAVGL